MNKITIYPKSPLTQSSKVELVRVISTQEIIKGYKNSVLNLDVERFFIDIEEVKVFECTETGYKFYYPFNIDGDGKFYRQLQSTPNYYPPNKWEFDVVANLVQAQFKVLEVGAGNGTFLKKINNKCEAFGLELNENVKEEAAKSNINITIESIEDHSRMKENYYDFVCSFQVVEHISNIHSFIEASINVLKPGGKLVVAVPNNDSVFFKFQKPLRVNKDLQKLTFLLNSPPHHMGQWNTKSLKSLGKVFNLKLDKILYEPVPDFRRPMLLEIIDNKYFFPFGVVLKKVVNKKFNFFRNKIKGDTIIGIYTKKN
jgi:SAM-dependent methyltransferase